MTRRAGRPAAQLLNGNTSGAWAEMEAWRAEFRLTTDEFARLVLRTSGGAYRGRKATEELPAEWHERFCAWRDAQHEGLLSNLTGPFPFYDAAAGKIVLVEGGYPVRRCENVRSREQTHREWFMPRSTRQRFCSAACRRDWHRQQAAQKEAM